MPAFTCVRMRRDIDELVTRRYTDSRLNKSSERSVDAYENRLHDFIINLSKSLSRSGTIDANYERCECSFLARRCRQVIYLTGRLSSRDTNIDVTRRAMIFAG